jgi:hypothetical protein
MKNLKFGSMICKSLLLLSIILICLESNAQIMKGTSVISGDLYAQYRTSEDNSGTSKYLDFSIAPSIGYFLAQNFSLNIALSASYTNSTTPSSLGPLGDSKNNSLGYYFSPSVKFYKTVTDKFYFNLQVFFLYGLRDEKYTPPGGSESKTSYTDMSMGIRPGFSYFVTDRIAFTSSLGTIGYSMTNDNTNDKKAGQFITNFGFNSLYFGLSFYLPKKL